MNNQNSHPNKSFIENFNRKTNNFDSVSLYYENFDIQKLKKAKFERYSEQKQIEPRQKIEIEKKPSETRKILVEQKTSSLVEKSKKLKKQKVPVVTEESKNKNATLQINENEKSFIEVDKPFVIKNNKLSIDENVITESIQKYTQPIYQSLRALSSGAGGGAVGIVSDDGTKQTTLLKSVNNLIFKGPGVQLTRKGKDIEVNISSSINTDVDFPRESTMLAVFSMLNQIDSLATQIGQVTIQPNYESIGNTAWINF